MPDTPDRRNRVAAVVTNFYAGSLTIGISDAAAQNTAMAVTASSMQRVLGFILAALAGETDPAELGLPPTSTPAVQINVITQE